MDDEQAVRQADRDDLECAAGRAVAEKYQPVIDTGFWSGQGQGYNGLSITWRARPEDTRCLRAAWVNLTRTT